MKKLFLFLFHEFIYAGHLLSLGAASTALAASFILKFDIDFVCFISLYLIVQPIYYYDRYRGFDKDFSANLARNNHIKKYKKFIPSISIVYTLLFVLILIVNNKYYNLIYGLLMLFLGLFYDLFFKKITGKIIAFKNIFVGLFWISFIHYASIYSSYNLFNFSSAILLFFVFFQMFIIQIFFDIKDLEADKKDGLRTFPTFIETKSLLTLLSIFEFMIIIPLFIGIYLEKTPFYTIFTLFFTLSCIYVFQSSKKQIFYSYYLFLGSEYIIWALSIFIGKYLLHG